MKKYNLFLSIFILYLLINMILLPETYITATSSGIRTWATNVLPCILPFMFFTKLLTNIGATENISYRLSPICKKLFNCPSVASSIFFTSVISGYPVGAMMTADLYQAGKITKSEAFRICSFCSTSGPMFIIGTVGASLLHSTTCGYIIFLSHIIGAFLNGLLYKKLNVIDLAPPVLQHTNTETKSFAQIITECVNSVLSVGAVIAIFFVIITSLNPLFSIFPPQISCVFEGLIEITKGCTTLANHHTGIPAVMLTTLLISFGGLSTIIQSITFLSRIQMPLKLLIKQKTTHALLAMGVSIVLSLIFL